MVFVCCSGKYSPGEVRVESKSALVLAMFGTTVEEALPGLLNIRVRVMETYPATPVHLAFTSKIIRGIWRQRAADDKYRAARPEIPEEFFRIRGPMATIAGLQEAGFASMVIQPVHMVPAEEYQELCAAVGALAASTFLQEGVRPLKLAVGRPAFGTTGAGDALGEELTAAAEALAADAEMARTRQAALLYMGHGSKRFPVGPLYQLFVEVMGRLYPDLLTAVALVDGAPTVHDVLHSLRVRGVKRILLKPLMVTAGDHVRKDMVGPPPRGWQELLSGEGFEVVPVLRGLGEHDPFAEIFVRHAADAAAGAGIVLR
ncbi:MAG: sirohydrochlorin cobaltochelatase [Desulfobulbus sp.]|nr:MAG: sirohydrochlorin cobaltochelatase [Desulfobulbus sp.]